MKKIENLRRRKNKIVTIDNGEFYELIRATSKFELSHMELTYNKDLHKVGKCGKKDKCEACKLLYDLIVTQNRSVTAINYAMRAHFKADAYTLDQFLINHQRLPKIKEWPRVKINTYQGIRRIVPELSSSISATVARKAEQRWRKDRCASLIEQNQNPSFFNNTLPIFLNSQTVNLNSNGKEWSLGFSLSSGNTKRQKEFIVPISPRDKFQKQALNNISSGKWKKCEISLVPDRRKKNKWYARISYKQLIPIALENEKLGAINKGIINCVAAVTWRGEQLIDEGHDIEAYLTRCEKYRREYERVLKFSKRRGKGRKKARKPIDRLSGKASRWRETRLQKTARYYALWFKSRDVTFVFIEDFTGIRKGEPEKLIGGEETWKRIQKWPYYQFQTRLISCLEEYGIRYMIVPANYISKICSNCKYKHEKMEIGKKRLFKCEKCGFKRQIDVVAAMNVLDRGREQLDGIDGGDLKLLNNLDGKSGEN